MTPDESIRPENNDVFDLLQILLAIYSNSQITEEDDKKAHEMEAFL
jgi:hypothetical protein